MLEGLFRPKTENGLKWKSLKWKKTQKYPFIDATNVFNTQNNVVGLILS